jgi:sulfoxide reductase heme-binding subunit YedZ
MAAPPYSSAVMALPRSGPGLLLWTIPAVSAASALPLAIHGLDADAIHLFLRATARLSGLLFLLPFTAAALHRLLRRPSTRWLVKQRRWLGLTFAAAHAWHAAAVILFLVSLDEPVSPVTGAGGTLGFAATAALAATSSDRAVRALGRRWRMLHLAGSYYLWFVFAFTGAGAAAAGGRPGTVSLAVWMVAALALRIAGRKR